MKTYKGKFSYVLPYLFFPLVLTWVFIAEQIPLTFIGYLGFFWAIFIGWGLSLRLSKIEVEDVVVRMKFCDVVMQELKREDVQKIEYGGVAPGGGIYSGRAVVYGKGTAILCVKKGEPLVLGISEKLYGRDAIEAVKKSLSGGSQAVGFKHSTMQ